MRATILSARCITLGRWGLEGRAHAVLHAFRRSDIRRTAHSHEASAIAPFSIMCQIYHQCPGASMPYESQLSRPTHQPLFKPFIGPKLKFSKNGVDRIAVSHSPRLGPRQLLKIKFHGVGTFEDSSYPNVVRRCNTLPNCMSISWLSGAYSPYLKGREVLVL